METERKPSAKYNALKEDPSREPLNVILLGKKSVGKTSLFLRIRDGTFNNNAKKPIPNSCVKEITVQGEKVKEKVKMTLYYPEPGMNTNNHHQSSLTRSYYSGAVVALIVYSADSAESIEGLGDIVKEILDNCNNAKLFLIRNKTDLDDTVTKEEALNKLKIKGYNTEIIKMALDTSAKSPKGLDRLLQEIGKVLLEIEDPARKKNITLLHSDSIDNNSSSHSRKNNCGC